MKVTYTTKIYALLSLITFLVVLVLLVLSWRYTVREGDELVARLSTIEEAQQRQQAYGELTRLVNETQADREELLSYVLTEDKTIDFLTSIEKAAVRNSVELTTESLRKVENKGRFDTLQVSFTFSGDKQDVQTMLRMLETLPYHSTVTQLSLQLKDASASGRIQALARLKLEVTLLKP